MFVTFMQEDNSRSLRLIRFPNKPTPSSVTSPQLHNPSLVRDVSDATSLRPTSVILEQPPKLISSIVVGFPKCLAPSSEPQGNKAILEFSKQSVMTAPPHPYLSVCGSETNWDTLCSSRPPNTLHAHPLFCNSTIWASSAMTIVQATSLPHLWFPHNESNQDPWGLADSQCNSHPGLWFYYMSTSWVL